MINVTVKCFSQVKYAFGEDQFILELSVGTTTLELEEMVREKANGQLDDISLRIAVNQKYTPIDIKLNNGDEVAFIPPVQGG
ncbi:MAG: MoaD/ThiS family protein [Candidatus Marinimicrobia bacterium]|mgnify:FL=1|jgi:molybdopterin converting factor small subunit|nr:MoaD/ThiS family protein [Candidatus Neomarinimicrobiota bacterium]MBT3937846.1 MoaD/ThiS family protein [Candidatus Neomarinimicrobiota bacterium]MBT3960778.1 MoaD/ThiS family protein [Candidatus Neomarinimicrobiota bacterium]MBT4383203.1 MoaD/ThiS family protein [Candidatus Neomarinimicrobiota bacterium]MBT4636004.1 MoaD/ThiS family protein [Candidatus Neomarinimicrobiota bacterium]